MSDAPGTGEGPSKQFVVDSKGVTSVKPAGLGQAARAKVESDVRPEKEPIGQRRAEEVGWVAAALFSKERNGSSPASESLSTAHWFGNSERTTPDSVEEANGKLASNDPAEKVDIYFMVGNTKVKLLKVVDASDPNKIELHYQEYSPATFDSNGTPIEAEKPTSEYDTEIFERGEFVESYLFMEQATIKAGFTDSAERAIVETHFKLIDPKVAVDDEPGDTPELQQQIKEVARNKFLIVDDVDSYIKGLLEQDMCTVAEAQGMMDLIKRDGGIVISPDGMRELLGMSGLDANGLSGKIQELGDQKTRLRERLATQNTKSPEGMDTQRQVDEAEAMQQLLKNAEQLFIKKDDMGNPDPSGRDEIERFFDKAYAGEIDFNKMGDLMQAFRSGDLQQVTEQLMEGLSMPEGLTEDEKREFKKNLVKGLKIAGVGVGAPIGILALIAVAIAAGAMFMSAGAMRSQ